MPYNAIFKMTAMLMAIGYLLQPENGFSSSLGGGRSTGEQYATEIIYAKTCGLDSSKIDRFEKGIPLLIMHMKVDQSNILEALDAFYLIKHDKEETVRIKHTKATPEGCGRVKRRMESALKEMDNQSILKGE